MTTRTLFATLGAAAISGALLVAHPSLAVEPVLGATLGTDAATIEKALAEDGYALGKFEREHGRIEVYATRDGRRLEIKIDPATGQVIRVEDDD